MTLMTATALDVLREHRGDWRGRHERRRQPGQFELRARPDGTGGTAYSFHGYAAAFEAPFEMWDAWGDPYQEVLAAGSCTRTLANAADVQFLIGHNEASIPLARTKSGTMQLHADTFGLEVVVPSLDGRSPVVQSLASAMERGDMDEMSIGFIATQQQWSPDWMTRRLTEINLHRGDVSMVCWAANPAANGASMTALPVSEAAARPDGAGRESRMPTAPYSAKPGEDAECPQCHSMNDADAAYCDQCGTAVRPSGASSAEEAETQRCGCGNWNAADAKFCDQCGTNLASDLDADNGGAGNGATPAPLAYDGYWSARRPDGEQRASADAGITGDVEARAAAGAPDYNAAEHGPGSTVCPGCGAANGLDARFCDQCGAGLYDNDALIEDPLTFSRQMRVRVLQLHG
jgi:HK97 family phage prohead protease